MLDGVAIRTWHQKVNKGERTESADRIVPSVWPAGSRRRRICVAVAADFAQKLEMITRGLSLCRTDYKSIVSYPCQLHYGAFYV
jgi:hypothetical protein